MIDIKSAKTKYYNHRARARRNKIPFNLTFDHWLNIWLESGKYEMRGTFKGGYVMSRYKDIGPYSVDNVYIQTVGDNNREAFNYNNKDFIQPRPGKQNHFYGKKHTEETKKLLSQISSNQIRTDETKEKASDSMKQYWKVNKELRLLSRPTKTCEHCNATMDPGNYTRHHGNNCKKKP